MKHAAYKTAKCLNRFLDYIIIILFFIAFFIGIYIILDVGYVFYSAAPEQVPFFSKVLGVEEEAYTMDELSDECIAWLTIDNTTIDYPIMYYKDNNKYLNLSPLGEYNLAGSIFLDYRNSPKFDEPYSLVYGHHMSNNYMFGALDLYEDPYYMLNHQHGTLTLRDGTVYRLFVFAYAALDASTEEVFKPGNMKDIDAFVAENTIYNGDHRTGKTLALTTCRNPGETMRTVVFCDLIDIE